MSWFWSPYPKTVWWAKDVLWNGIAWGKRKQTISDRIGDKLRAGRWWARLLDRILFRHFSRSVEASTVQGWWSSSAGMLVGALILVGLGAARWWWPEFMVRWIETPYYAALLVWLLAQEGAKLLGRRPR